MTTLSDTISTQPHPMTLDNKRASVLESPRRTKVISDVDVLVVGGGPAGIAAALAAARAGAKTLCVERHGMLGGVWTAGLLNPLFDAVGKGWLVEELIQRLISAKAWCDWNWTNSFDTEVMKLVLEQMMTEAGAEWWYYCSVVDAIVEGGRLRGAIVEGKSGREAVLAKVVVDCSGDGDLAARAGASYELGRKGDGLCQPMTLMFEVDGIGSFKDQKSSERLYDQLREAMVNMSSVELPFGRVKNAPWIINLPRTDTAVVQATHVYKASAINTGELTRATVEARRQAHELVRLLRGVPSLENIRLTQTAPAIGVREARRICGHYQLTLDDINTGKRFNDAITFGTFPLDVHEVNPDEPTRSSRIAATMPYEIPYRCLLPMGLEGLLVAGRCISGTHEAHASYRVTGTCMGMGQAAGLAAAMAAANEQQPGQLDGGEIGRALAQHSAGLLGTRSPEEVLGEHFGEKLVWE